ncbi:hypothetical protein D3C84_408000 [compost metagenome]
MVSFNTEVVSAWETTTYQLVYREQRLESPLADFPTARQRAHERKVGGQRRQVPQVATDAVVPVEVDVSPFRWVEVEPVLLTVQRQQVTCSGQDGTVGASVGNPVLDVWRHVLEDTCDVQTAVRQEHVAGVVGIRLGHHSNAGVVAVAWINDDFGKTELEVGFIDLEWQLRVTLVDQIDDHLFGRFAINSHGLKPSQEKGRSHQFRS